MASVGHLARSALKTLLKFCETALPTKTDDLNDIQVTIYIRLRPGTTRSTIIKGPIVLSRYIDTQRARINSCAFLIAISTANMGKSLLYAGNLPPSIMTTCSAYNFADWVACSSQEETRKDVPRDLLAR